MSASNYLAPNNIVSYTIGDNNLTVEAKSNGYGIGFECKLTAGQNYTLSWVGTNVYVGISFYDGDGAQLSYVTSGASPKTFTVPESTANAIIVLRADNANVTGEFSNVQLEEDRRQPPIPHTRTSARLSDIIMLPLKKLNVIYGRSIPRSLRAAMPFLCRAILSFIYPLAHIRLVRYPILSPLRLSWAVIMLTIRKLL